ncbi:hypothetical protein [Bradyrhizobium sp. JR3.5]
MGSIRQRRPRQALAPHADELAQLGERTGVDGRNDAGEPARAKVDSVAVRTVSLHGFFATRYRRWTVVQQGVNGDKRQAWR